MFLRAFVALLSLPIFAAMDSGWGYDWLMSLVQSTDAGTIHDCREFADRVRSALFNSGADLVFEDKGIANFVRFGNETVFNSLEDDRHYFLVLELRAFGHTLILEILRNKLVRGRIWQTWVDAGAGIGYTAREWVMKDKFQWLQEKKLKGFFNDMRKLQRVLNDVVESDLRPCSAALLQTNDLDLQRAWAGSLINNIEAAPLTLMPGDPETLDYYEEAFERDGSPPRAVVLVDDQQVFEIEAEVLREIWRISHKWFGQLATAETFPQALHWYARTEPQGQAHVATLFRLPVPSEAEL